MTQPFEDIRERVEKANGNVREGFPAWGWHVSSLEDCKELLSAVDALDAKLETQKKIDKALLHQLEMARQQVDALMEVGRAAHIVHNQCAAVNMDKVTAIGRLAVHGTLDGPLGALPPELKEALK